MTTAQSRSIRLLATFSLLIAMVSIGVPERLNPGLGVYDAHAASAVRRFRDVCDWDAFSWEELRPAEQRLWAQIGWNSSIWNSPNGYPPADDLDWNKLTRFQRSAMAKLGYNAETWDNEDCPG